MNTSENVWLDLFRRRRDHFEKVYFQQESRAQFVSTLATGVAAALLTSAGGNLGHINAVGWVMRLWLLALFVLLVTLLLALTTFYPLERTRFGVFVLDLVAGKIGLHHLAADRRKFATKPQNMDDLCVFVQKVVARDFSQPSSDDPILRAELYNLWAQWFVTERRAGLLRWAIVLLAFALPLSGGAFFAVKSVVPVQESESIAVTRSIPEPSTSSDAASRLTVQVVEKRTGATPTSSVAAPLAGDPVTSTVTATSTSSGSSSSSGSDAGRPR